VIDSARATRSISFSLKDHTETLIDLALAEDLGDGDVTSQYFIPADRRARAFITARRDGVVSGIELAARVFEKVDPTLSVEILIEDGSRVSEGEIGRASCRERVYCTV
jgi:nicotinate-nucleotide pyrophosphorylase (carboxylating)